MGLADIVRSGIATAKKVTSGLQADVTFEAWTGQSSTGVPTYADSVPLPAIIEESPRLVRLLSGSEVMSRARIAILQPVTATVATGRRNPIDPRDKFTLPSGTTGPILDVPGGLVDPSTGAPYMFQIALG